MFVIRISKHLASPLRRTGGLSIPAQFNGLSKILKKLSLGQYRLGGVACMRLPSPETTGRDYLVIDCLPAMMSPVPTAQKDTEWRDSQLT